MTNVLFSSFYEHARMGGQRSLLQLLSNLDRQRIKPWVLVPQQGELTDALDAIDVPWIALKIPGLKLNNIAKMYRTKRQLERFCKQNSIHVIHADHDKHMFALTFVSRALGIPSVYHARVSSSRKYDSYLSSRVDHIVAISKGVVPRFASKPDREVSVIFNGYDTNEFFALPYKDPTFFEDCFDKQTAACTAVFAGQLKREKGVVEIVEALALLHAEDAVDIRVVFAGEETEVGFLKHVQSLAKRLGVDSRCAFVGQQPNIAEFFRHADFVLFPSHEGAEGMGRVPFEAMACGTPVIGTDISGVNEVVTQENGRLIPEQSPSELAQAIHELSCDEALRITLGKNAIQWAAAYFTIDRHVSQMTDLFERLKRTS